MVLRNEKKGKLEIEDNGGIWVELEIANDLDSRSDCLYQSNRVSFAIYASSTLR